jgi:hypothetical protein
VRGRRIDLRRPILRAQTIGKCERSCPKNRGKAKLHSKNPAFKNGLLQRLNQGDLLLIKRHLERVELKLRTVLYRPEALIESVYFPETCIASIVARLPRGRDAEVGALRNANTNGWSGQKGVGGAD